ncbi:helix-turn-helix domain-containing protein [Actinophytocola sediminis]
MSDNDGRRADFGERLRRLRMRAGYLTGKEFARHIGWQQSKVSRLETGKQTATDSDVITWCEAAGASESVASELINDLRELRIEAASWRRQLRTGHSRRQREAKRVETAARRIRVFELAVLPGLVQTPDYARHVLAIHARMHGVESDVDQAVRVRMERQAIIYDRERTIEMIVLESTLRYPPCPADVMAAQLDRLLAVCSMNTIRFGIIPLDTQLPVISNNGFWVFDDSSVIVETTDSEITEEEPEDVALYHRIMDELWTVAVEGDAARALLLRTLEQRRGTPYR